MKKNKLRQDFGNETGQTIRQEAYITFNKEYVEWLEDKLIKALTIPVVSNQRELLIAFSNKLCYDLGLDFDNEEEYINEFLSNL